MALSAFTPTNYGGMSAVSATSGNQAIPGGAGPTLLVSNLGPNPAVVLLGTSNAVTVTASTGIAVIPGQSIPLTVGSNTYIASIGVGGDATLNLAQGT